MSDPEPPKVGDRGSSASTPLALSKRGTIIVRIRRSHQLGAVRWVRGILIAGVATGVVAIARHCGAF